MEGKYKGRKFVWDGNGFTITINGEKKTYKKAEEGFEAVKKLIAKAQRQKKRTRFKNKWGNSSPAQ